MLTLPDIKAKQVLFIMTDAEENRLQFKNQNIAFYKKGELADQISSHQVLIVFIIGDVSLTSVLIKKCRQLGVSLILMKSNFEVYASILASAEGNYLLRSRQYQMTKQKELHFSKLIVKNKLINQLRLLRKNKLITAKEYEIRRDEIINKLEKTKSDKQILGIEGSRSKDFFVLYFKDYNWYKRLPRTKVDINNYLMDIGYTFLFNFIDALVNLYGFDSYKGFYHLLFFQRKSLACDLMEPFRCLIDQQIVKSFNLKQINVKDFEFKNERYFLPFDKQQKYIKFFLACLMDNKEEIFSYVRKFYYCVINDSADYPFFKVK